MSLERKHPSKPTRTQDLVRLLTADETSSKEKAALKAWSTQMVSIFAKTPRNRDYLVEVDILSIVLDHNDLCETLRTSSNYVAQGTADGDDIDPKILICFSHIIRQTNGKLPASVVQLGSVLSSLHRRLNAAKANADIGLQYRLISTLSIVLDAMCDIGVTGLSRTTIREPLLKLLNGLADHKELRLAQAAGYAYQALLGVQDDETTSQAAWRNFGNITNGLLIATGAVTTMDPGKFVAAGFDLAQIPDYLANMKEAYDSLKNAIVGEDFASKQKQWYRDLRYTDICLKLGCLDDLTKFIRSEKRDQKEFLCGLFSQLEAFASELSGPSRREALTLISEMLIEVRSDNRRVQSWANMISKSLELDQPSWASDLPTVHRWYSRNAHQYKQTLELMSFREIRSVETPTTLIDEAWIECKEAQLFYAIAALEEHYCDAQRLDVERVSGDNLPMSQCYINLAIVQGRRGVLNSRPSNMSFYARLNIASSDTKDLVSLPKLLDSQNLPDGSFGPPKRILIEGAAGVGKTTLCKKIVHDYIYHKMWQQSHDCIIWLPLRKLKSKSRETYNLEDLLYEEYFSHRREGKQFALALTNAADRHHNGVEVLFLLDGFDEVAQEWIADSAMDKFLLYILKQKNVIVTSRPFGLDRKRLGRFDLELETIGFQLKQIDAYTNNREIIPNPRTSQEIQSFIRVNPLIHTLVRIPIQLDALCSTWNDQFEDVPNTMTTMYQAIINKLWQKDMNRLEKTVSGLALNERLVHGFDTELQIRDLVEQEQNLLDGLAFSGLYNDIIEFTLSNRRQVYEIFRENGYDLPISRETALRKVSFLRTSDNASPEKSQTFHFLHLTFQEFFAARFFMSHWRDKKEICCVMIKNKKKLDKQSLNTFEFLQNQKYNPRYLIFWRFVAGMIHSSSDQKPLSRFLGELQDEPRDLLGPTHQRLLMHCLSEIPSGEEVQISNQLREIRKEFADWAMFEFKTYGTTHLSCYDEFPEDILLRLTEESLSKQMRIFEGVVKTSRLSTTTLDQLLSMVKRSPSQGKEPEEIMAVGRHCNFNSSPIVTEFLAIRLKDKDSSVRFSAANVLSRCSELPQNILQTLVGCLKDGDPNVRHNATEALSNCSELPRTVLDGMVRYLRDEEFNARYSATKALASRSELPQSILELLVGCLKDEDSNVRQSAASAMNYCADLSRRQSILEALVGCLKDEYSYVRHSATIAMSRCSELPQRQSILEALVACLKDEDFDVRHGAALVLENYSELPRNILETLVEHLEDEAPDRRHCAVRALKGCLEVPQNILEALVGCLNDDDYDVGYIAAITLGRFSLPEKILETLVVRLKDEEYVARDHVTMALRGSLGGYSQLSQSLPEELGICLKDEDSKVRSEAATTLGGCSKPPLKILEALIGCLKDEHRPVRHRTARTLSGYAQLPSDVLEALVDYLGSEDYFIRWKVAEALNKPPDLPQNILRACVGLLNMPERGGREAADILSKHKDFLYMLPSFDHYTLECIYRYWLRWSFKESQQFFILPRKLVIGMPEGVQEVGFEDSNQCKVFLERVRSIQLALEIPGL